MKGPELVEIDPVVETDGPAEIRARDHRQQHRRRKHRENADPDRATTEQPGEADLSVENLRGEEQRERDRIPGGDEVAAEEHQSIERKGSNDAGAGSAIQRQQRSPICELGSVK